MCMLTFSTPIRHTVFYSEVFLSQCYQFWNHKLLMLINFAYSNSTKPSVKCQYCWVTSLETFVCPSLNKLHFLLTLLSRPLISIICGIIYCSAHFKLLTYSNNQVSNLDEMANKIIYRSLCHDIIAYLKSPFITIVCFNFKMDLSW